MSATDPKRPVDPTGTGDAASGAAVPGAAPGDTETDTGRHAVSRPAPTPPGPVRQGHDAPDPVRPPADDASAGTPSPVPTRPAAGGSGTDEGRSGTDRARSGPDGDRSGADDELFPDSHAPRTPHAGTHVLGALVGLVLAPLALGLLLLGQSRILRVQVEGWDASLELLGIVLVSAGALLLAGLLALGLWSAAVPLTAGLVLGVVGGLQIYAPGIARETTLDVVGADSWELTVTQATVAGTSGTTIAVGVLLLTAGAVVALTRRHGVRLGAFRERNRTV
ncbi:hypothetical protein [Cellulomonas dongxiuzhuiae]|uniref:Uncharacterized protein n=1 Tax=Cellulomonas dongxiuzhuiae TaxID=2819979 RepID=A0ABX8GHR7_9CELL|nr:hypothetical protein [Cellulomonas dongxiuzhuiae]MBO3094351.1 hypothetical protein [Cellulomonas dongxiuzhuiae]QWC15388.1 hypothetical protein KKR89_13895 [Cellulomonas dongxiuzhuiae]